MAPYSQTDLSVQDLIEQARVLRAQAFARGIKKAIQAISPARSKAASDVVQPDLFQQPALMQEDSYFLPLVTGGGVERHAGAVRRPAHVPRVWPSVWQRKRCAAPVCAATARRREPDHHVAGS